MNVPAVSQASDHTDLLRRFAARRIASLALGERSASLDGLASLLREVEDVHGEPRFVMLELLREFGLERLVELCSDKGTKPRDLGPCILSSVRKFVGDYPQSDDMCIVFFGRVNH